MSLNIKEHKDEEVTKEVTLRLRMKKLPKTDLTKLDFINQSFVVCNTSMKSQQQSQPQQDLYTTLGVGLITKSLRTLATKIVSCENVYSKSGVLVAQW